MTKSDSEHCAPHSVQHRMQEESRCFRVQLIALHSSSLLVFSKLAGDRRRLSRVPSLSTLLVFPYLAGSTPRSRHIFLDYCATMNDARLPGSCHSLAAEDASIIQPASCNDDFFLLVVVARRSQSLAPIKIQRLRKRFGEALPQRLTGAFLAVYTGNFLDPADPPFTAALGVSRRLHSIQNSRREDSRSPILSIHFAVASSN